MSEQSSWAVVLTRVPTRAGSAKGQRRGGQLLSILKAPLSKKNSPLSLLGSTKEKSSMALFACKSHAPRERERERE